MLKNKKNFCFPWCGYIQFCSVSILIIQYQFQIIPDYSRAHHFVISERHLFACTSGMNNSTLSKRTIDSFNKLRMLTWQKFNLLAVSVRSLSGFVSFISVTVSVLWLFFILLLNDSNRFESFPDITVVKKSLDNLSLWPWIFRINTVQSIFKHWPSLQTEFTKPSLVFPLHLWWWSASWLHWLPVSLHTVVVQFSHSSDQTRLF